MSLLGRDIDKVIIIDNVCENFQLHKNNGIHIINFEGKEEDIELFLLSYELKKIALSNNGFYEQIEKLQKIMNLRRSIMS